jgi:hypothetical protein
LGLMPYKAGPGGHKPRHKEKRNTFKMHNRLGALTQPRGTKLLARMARVARPRCRRVPLTPIFGSGVGMVDFLAPTYNALGRPPLESRTCSTAALPGASCPSPPTWALRWSTRRCESASSSSRRGQSVWSMPALRIDPDVATFSFPLPELKVEPAPLWPPMSSALEICMPWDTSLTYRTVTSILSSVGISFSSIDITA